MAKGGVEVLRLDQRSSPMRAARAKRKSAVGFSVLVSPKRTAQQGRRK
jgi:hypothetical protein